MSRQTTAPARLGCVKYLNTLPLIEGLSRCADVSLRTAAPSALAAMLRAGEADLALASVADYARAEGSLRLVPAGMIGSDGPTLTVRVFSRVPLARARTLHADGESHTSVVLAQVLLRAVHGQSVEVVAFDAARPIAADGPETVLLIGDKVVSGAPAPDLYPHQMDLGEAWKQWTGLPFVYACWMCREGEQDSPAVRLAADALDRQRRRNAARLAWIASRHAAERGWPIDLALRYISDHLLFEVTDTARAGVERFFAESAAMSLLPACSARWAW